jgi:hypothetical protein
VTRVEGRRIEVSGELGPAATDAESSRPATRRRTAQRGVGSASMEWAALDADVET